MGASAFGATLEDTWASMPDIGEVHRQLDEWGIGDRQLSDESARKRYARFSGVDFGVAPPEAWGKLRRDLLEFEDHLAAEQHDVGDVPAYPFSMELRREASVHQKPTPLPPQQRAWVNQEMAQRWRRQGLSGGHPLQSLPARWCWWRRGKKGKILGFV